MGAYYYERKWSMAEVKARDLFEEAKQRYENTTARWRDQWWEVICDIYERCKEWRNKYKLDKTTREVIKRVKEIFEGIVEKVPIIFAKGTKLCYLFKFYDSNGDLLFSKVGTTEDRLMTRLRREIRDYSKKYDVYGVVIESVIDCGNTPPEGAESSARALFISQNPKSYIKNDRFINFDVSVEDFNNCVLNYLKTCPVAA